MIDLQALLARLSGGAVTPADSAGTTAARGLFPAVLSALRGGEVVAQGAGPSGHVAADPLARVDAILAEAAAWLADPDLSDIEIAGQLEAALTRLRPVLSQIMAVQTGPSGQGATAVLAALSSGPGGEAEAVPPAPRGLAAALPALGEVLRGMAEAGQVADTGGAAPLDATDQGGGDTGLAVAALPPAVLLLLRAAILPEAQAPRFAAAAQSGGGMADIPAGWAGKAVPLGMLGQGGRITGSTSEAGARPATVGGPVVPMTTPPRSHAQPPGAGLPVVAPVTPDATPPALTQIAATEVTGRLPVAAGPASVAQTGVDPAPPRATVQNWSPVPSGLRPLPQADRPVHAPAAPEMTAPLATPVPEPDEPARSLPDMSVTAPSLQPAATGARTTTAPVTPVAAQEVTPSGSPEPPQAAPQPVAQAPQTLPSAAPQTPAQQATPQAAELFGQIRAQVTTGSEMRISLTPDNLGGVEIDVLTDETGQLRIAVRAEHPAVLSLMRADRDGLLALLREVGHAIDDKGLSLSDFGTGGEPRGDRQTPQRPAGALLSVAPLTEGETPAETSPKQPATAPSGGVDLRI
ncbi:flagellar hook-length control protein FliK [Pseudooceanicola aestuarii]|uniref:flagellar hook-length control protein FliK n=1 Tax=Pseudooceanicola aestuarii TaxID=2697319 RepID=UPI0013D066A9|nr:flagellar hook-length control protein FliK [Pseudooceanicola aestuarii]